MNAVLIDTYGRVATDLRISLTDRCNLRCGYCLPEDKARWLPKPDLLTDDEIIRLVRIAVGDLGVREVRFTGGEPLLRPGLVQIVAACAALQPRPKLSLTTNGIGLHRSATALRAAGLDRVNVSLDTLRRDAFRALTARDRLPAVLDGLAAAQAAGLEPIKINAVLIRGINDDEAPDLLRWARSNGYLLRFIEQMPLGAAGDWQPGSVVTADEVLHSLAARYRLTPAPARERGSAPAEEWLVDGGPARVGVIASVTRPFCRACNRTRLTADGQVRSCLFARQESDLRGAIRSGATDGQLAQRWAAAMWRKQADGGLGTASFQQPERPMSAIGG